MKKFLFAAAFFVFSSFAFAEKNLVFVLGLTQGEVTYYQKNSSLDPVKFSGKQAGMTFAQLIGGPQKEGSRFISMSLPEKKEKEFGLKSVIFEDQYCPLQKGKQALEVKPNSRGICLFFSGTNVYELENLEAWKKNGMFKKAVISLLNKAIEQYAGTEWESSLKAELEEWK